MRKKQESYKLFSDASSNEPLGLSPMSSGKMTGRARGRPLPRPADARPVRERETGRTPPRLTSPARFVILTGYKEMRR